VYDQTLKVVVLCLSYFTNNSIIFGSFKSQLDETSAFAFLLYRPYTLQEQGLPFRVNERLVWITLQSEELNRDLPFAKIPQKYFMHKFSRVGIDIYNNASHSIHS